MECSGKAIHLKYIAPINTNHYIFAVYCHPDKAHQILILCSATMNIFLYEAKDKWDISYDYCNSEILIYRQYENDPSHPKKLFCEPQYKFLFCFGLFL